ncbi:MAG: DinB family protein [Gemmatimonadaceae bacterium]
MTHSTGQEFLERSRYYLAEEYPVKIRRCVAALPEGAVWKRANESSNSIGNLLLHLAGNVRQWIVGGVGGLPVTRDRPAEFAARDGPDAATLLAGLESAVREADAVMAGLTEADLLEPRTIQGRETNVLAAIYHVVEHFGMHTGQIVLMTKASVPGAIRFYDDSVGNATPTWGGKEGMR